MTDRLTSTGTVPVEVRITNIDCLERGAIRWLFSTEVEISGAVFTVQGLQGRIESDGALVILAPQMRTAGGRWADAIVFPSGVLRAIGDCFVEELRGRAPALSPDIVASVSR